MHLFSLFVAIASLFIVTEITRISLLIRTFLAAPACFVRAECSSAKGPGCTEARALVLDVRPVGSCYYIYNSGDTQPRITYGGFIGGRLFQRGELAGEQ